MTFFIAILGMECFSPGNFALVRAALFVPIAVTGVLTLYGFVGSIKFKKDRDFVLCAATTFFGLQFITPMRKGGIEGLLDVLFAITVCAIGLLVWNRITRKKGN